MGNDGLSSGTDSLVYLFMSARKLKLRNPQGRTSWVIIIKTTLEGLAVNIAAYWCDVSRIVVAWGG